MIDRVAMAAAVDDFAATVQGEFSVEDILEQLARSAGRVLDVDGAGVMVPAEGSLLRFVFATDGPTGELEALQQQLQQGPCRDSRAQGRVLNLADLAVEGSWPRFQARAAELGISAVTAVPLFARGRNWGVLDVYRRRAQRLDAEQLAAAKTLANLATSYLLVTADRDAARRAQAEMAHHAMHDPLTGAPVRWVFLEQLAHAVRHLRRGGGQLAVLFIDLDGLKYVNDTYGHLAGDRLLTTCVERLREAVRPVDILARIGGDEFVVLLEHVGGIAEAAAVAQRVLDHLSEPYEVEGQVLQPSASIGLAVTDDPKATPDTLIAHADSAMYVAKRAGRARLHVFDPAGYAAERAASRAADELGPALQASLHEQRRGVSADLEVHYQQIFAVAGASQGAGEPDEPHDVRRTLYGVEALVRWRHPRHGLLEAGEFVPAAERAGLLTQLDDWVLHETCAQLARWDRLLGPRSPQRAFLNVSADELTHSTLPARISAATGRAGVAADRLTLEVTETGLFTNPHAADVAVAAVLELGCQLAIDDFGAGYSSLARMEQVPAAVIKIDGSFARDLPARPVAAAVIRAVLLLGAQLDRTVVMEGVEDAGAMDALLRLGATHLQGHHLARPLRGDELAAELAAPPEAAVQRTRARAGHTR